MKRPTQERPTAVPGLTGSTQVGKIPVKMARRQRRMGTQATVWTDRLLAALEYGVQGGQRLLCAGGAVLTGTSLHQSVPIHEDGPLTGKPDAGNPPVRFGGRGGRRYGVLPYPDQAFAAGRQLVVQVSRPAAFSFILNAAADDTL